MSVESREEQNRCLREIECLQSAEKSYVDAGAQILELARHAQELFERQRPREKRRLLNFILSNCYGGMAKRSRPSVNPLMCC
jgi:site-specific DNA recombinase